jgi:hypothetical protein
MTKRTTGKKRTKQQLQPSLMARIKEVATNDPWPAVTERLKRVAHGGDEPLPGGSVTTG